MNRYRRRRTPRRSEPPQLWTRPGAELSQLESSIIRIGPAGSFQPIRSLPPRRWRWALYMLLAWGDRWPILRRTHDWLARRIGMQIMGRAS